ILAGCSHVPNCLTMCGAMTSVVMPACLRPTSATCAGRSMLKACPCCIPSAALVTCFGFREVEPLVAARATADRAGRAGRDRSRSGRDCNLRGAAVVLVSEGGSTGCGFRAARLYRHWPCESARPHAENCAAVSFAPGWAARAARDDVPSIRHLRRASRRPRPSPEDPVVYVRGYGCFSAGTSGEVPGLADDHFGRASVHGALEVWLRIALSGCRILGGPGSGVGDRCSAP